MSRNVKFSRCLLSDWKRPTQPADRQWSKAKLPGGRWLEVRVNLSGRAKQKGVRPHLGGLTPFPFQFHQMNSLRLPTGVYCLCDDSRDSCSTGFCRVYVIEEHLGIAGYLGNINYVRRIDLFINNGVDAIVGLDMFLMPEAVIFVSAQKNTNTWIVFDDQRRLLRDKQLRTNDFGGFSHEFQVRSEYLEPVITG